MKYLLIFIFIISFSSVYANSFDGTWEVVFDCTGATGIHEEKCSQGDRDKFNLYLKTSDTQICGLHFATAHLGNRVDDGNLTDYKLTIDGTFKGNLAEIKYRSAWGGSGLAEMRIEESQLKWIITKRYEGQSWLPQEATLKKKSEVSDWFSCISD